MGPNLLFIYTDEQAVDTLATYGNERIHMPNLNRLAKESVVFDQAYVTQPVCTPSRSTLLTGLYPHTSGCTENNVPLRPDVLCLPEMLTHGDYATAHYGKWHLGDEVFAQHGFGDWRSIEDGYEAYYSEGRDRAQRSSYHQFLIENGFTPQNGEHELYNLRQDPCETRNLAPEPEYNPLITGLTEEIRKWQLETGDTVRSQH